VLTLSVCTAQLNVSAPLRLTRRLAPSIVERKVWQKCCSGTSAYCLDTAAILSGTSARRASFLKDGNR
jgi:hypothetical protein